MAGMPTVLSWIDHSTKDRQRVRDALKLLQESGTVDELGLSTLRDGFANAFFPGTSTIQTRLRYFLFVPWIYRRLAHRRVKGATVAKDARAMEIALIKSLQEGGDEVGLIGRTVGKDLVRLPSEAYWGGLREWGILQEDLSRGQLHSRWDGLRRRDFTQPDDPGARHAPPSVWRKLPPGPLDPGSSWPDKLDFALVGEEPAFLQGRMLQGAGENRQDTVLAWLAERRRSIDVDTVWDLPLPARLRPDVDLARRFSSAMHGAALLYNVLAGTDSTRADHRERALPRHREALTGWAEEAPGEGALTLRIEELETFAERRGLAIHPGLRGFLAGWLERLAAVSPAGIAQDAAAEALIRDRELQVKPADRARLTNTRALERWGGDSGSARMTFRWSNVQRLVDDLHRSLP